MRKCGIGWKTRSKVVRDVIRRLEEWGFVGTEVEYTNGRPKVRIYPKQLDARATVGAG
jgi:DNA-binding PadR family transcriptional regulator